MDAAIMTHAIVLERCEIAPRSNQSLSGGPSFGWFRSQSWNRGDDFENEKAAIIKKTTVGIKGRTAPISPSATQTHPRQIHRTRVTVSTNLHIVRR